ncbi:MAG: RtcB family protein [Proteobacteria bacterium]|nr:RtcB family protein [Pseudomonadota bacterium]MBU1060747.1 RtcB family protein [Pseudomonadota bacterium]
MRRTIKSEKKPIKLWLEDMDSGAMEQARNLANLPFVHSHIAIMPDAHLGYGMPIGGVLATEGVVIPNAVGVDIGCGMCAQQTSLHSLDSEQLKALLAHIRKTIPLGFKHHKQAQDSRLMPRPKGGLPVDNLQIVSRQYESGRSQLGTLGGGNHFIEIQKGSDGFIWIMIHSGSRNLGFQVANFYNKLANRLSGRFGSTVPKNWQLAFLPVESKEGQQYLLEMEYCVDFAYANRKLMMERVKEGLLLVAPPVQFGQFVNIAHNYASLETHFHEDVLVHRKGATRAREGEIGIIPGSQGTPSYLVRGKGNRESFQSCSHGAGRKMGRKQAQRSLDLHEEQKKLEDQGILHAIRSRRDLDEAAGAYKDIDEVVENQLDLVEVIVTLKPLAVIKG